MRHGFCILAVGALCAATFTRMAMATVTLVDDRRAIDLLVDSTDFGGTSLFNPLPVSPGFGVAWNLATGSGPILSPTAAGTGEVNASQISSFDTTPLFSSITASGTADGSISADFDSVSVNVSADSTFEILFTVTSPQDYTLSGSVVDEGSGSTGRVRLRPAGGANIFIQSTTGSFNDSGTLAPGDYELIGEAKAIGFTTSTGFFNKSGSFDLMFNVVPEPAAALLLSVGAVMILRRRRQYDGL